MTTPPPGSYVRRCPLASCDWYLLERDRHAVPEWREPDAEALALYDGNPFHAVAFATLRAQVAEDEAVLRAHFADDHTLEEWVAEVVRLNGELAPPGIAALSEPLALLLKYSQVEDFYVAWSKSDEGPVWCGTRAEAVEVGYAEDRIARADRNGTSSQPFLDLACTRPWPPFYAWGSDGMIAEQRGHLPRRFLRAYALLYLAGERQAAFDLLEPLEEVGEVRRD